MIELTTNHLNKITTHVNQANQDKTLSLSCMFINDGKIGDGTLQVIPHKTDAYKVRVDDQESGMPIGVINKTSWLTALKKGKENLDKGHTLSPLFVKFETV